MLTSYRGQIAYCDQRRIFAVDNLVDGFDLYRLDKTGATLIRNFRTRPVNVGVPKQVIFSEEGKVVVGGSDHGLIYVFDRRSGDILDEMPHGNGGLVQTISVCPFTNPLLFLIQV
jgi:hypothetical protein